MRKRRMIPPFLFQVPEGVEVLKMTNYRLLVSGLLLLVATSIHAADPRLEIDDVRHCVENSKKFMRAFEYTGQENEQDLIAACRKADPDCVTEAGESLHTSVPLEPKAFLKIVRACKGRDMGKCFRA